MVNYLRKSTIVSPNVWVPSTLEEAWSLKQKFGREAGFIAGGAFLQTQWQKGVNCPDHLISLKQIEEMQRCGKELINGETVLSIGALTTLEFCRHPSELLEDVPLLVEAVRNIAAPSIRNIATLGGNIANEFGDTIPALLAMDASLTFFDGKKVCQKTLAECLKEKDFFSEFILISVSLPEVIKTYKENYFYKKIGSREGFTPSIVTVSGCCQLNQQKQVEHIRLAVSGSTTQPQRLLKCEQLLQGNTLSHERLQKAVQVIREEFQCSTETISSTEYKKAAAANMIVSEIARLAG